jgi:hypothetical protein
MASGGYEYIQMNNMFMLQKRELAGRIFMNKRRCQRNIIVKCVFKICEWTYFQPKTK